MNYDSYMILSAAFNFLRKRAASAIFVTIAFGVVGYLAIYNLRISSTELEDQVSMESSGNTDGEGSAGTIFVDLSGAVSSPGVYELPRGSRIADLVVMGGTFLSTSSQEWVSRHMNLAQVLLDGQKVYVPFEDEVLPLGSLSANIELYQPLNSQGPALNGESDDGPVPGRTENVSDELPDSDPGKVNVNTASQIELESLKGIGKAYSARIIENRPYKDMNELVEKSKVPEKTLRNLESSITF